MDETVFSKCPQECHLLFQTYTKVKLMVGLVGGFPCLLAAPKAVVQILQWWPTVPLNFKDTYGKRIISVG